MRYDGAGKRFKARSKLQSVFNLRPFCPEVAIGLGVPRTTLRLVGESADTDAVRVLENGSDRDLTPALQNYADAVADQIKTQNNLVGFVVCKGSPSCGMQAVKRYGGNGHPLGFDASGAFTARLMQRMPQLPVEEDGRLNDRGLMENFLVRIYAYDRWQKMLTSDSAGGLRKASLLDFHRRHKFLLLAHDQATYRRLGPELARLSSGPGGKKTSGQKKSTAERASTAEYEELRQQADNYFSQFMSALAKVPGHGDHTNVLMHLQGFVKQQISSRERNELADLILAYKNREVPRQAPVALLKHHFLRNPNDYVQSQHYFRPFPEKVQAELLSIHHS